MRFVVDAQLSPALAQSGNEATHVFDLAMAQATDTQIWNYAHNHGAVIVTKDEDFVARRLMVQAGPQILWVRIGNATTVQLISRMKSRLPEMLSLLAQGEKLVELV